MDPRKAFANNDEEATKKKPAAQIEAAKLAAAQEHVTQLKQAIARPKIKVSLAAEGYVAFFVYFPFNSCAQSITQFFLSPHSLCSLCSSLFSRCEVYAPYDPFVTPLEPSNPWISDDTTAWDTSDKR